MFPMLLIYIAEPHTNWKIRKTPFAANGSPGVNSSRSVNLMALPLTLSVGIRSRQPGVPEASNGSNS